MTLIFGRGGPSDPEALPLATKDGWRVPNEQKPEDSPERRLAARDIWAVDRPQARCRTVSGTYNCMGLVFGARRTTIDIEHLERILIGDHLRRLSATESPQIGDVVVYRRDGSPQHVGWVTEVGLCDASGALQVEVLSQWGFDGEYFHSLDHVPTIYGTPEFWTDRRQDD